MAKIRTVLRHIFLWSYARGTIQYDIICALILAFIFFVPRSCFLPRKVETSRSVVKQTQASDNLINVEESSAERK